MRKEKEVHKIYINGQSITENKHHLVFELLKARETTSLPVNLTEAKQKKRSMGESTEAVSTDLSVKLSDELAEDDRVHVVRQQMEQAPVPLGGKI